VRNAPRNTQSNQIGKPTPRPAALENTNVTVAPSSPGDLINIYVSVAMK